MFNFQLILGTSAPPAVPNRIERRQATVGVGYNSEASRQLNSKFTELEKFSFASPLYFFSYATYGKLSMDTGVNPMFDFQLILSTSAIATLSKGKRGVL